MPFLLLLVFVTCGEITIQQNNGVKVFATIKTQKNILKPGQLVIARLRCRFAARRWYHWLNDKRINNLSTSIHQVIDSYFLFEKPLKQCGYLLPPGLFFLWKE